MRRPLAAISALLGFLSFDRTAAQTASDPNEGLAISAAPATPGTYQVGWWGRAGHTYFLQRSTDLTAPWEYFPDIATGADAPILYGFATDAPRVFVRLRVADQTYFDPYAHDSDADGLSNQEEFWVKTDPFGPDFDGDGVVDGLDAFPADPARHLFAGTLAVSLLSPPNAIPLP